MDYDCTMKYFQNLKEKKLCRKGVEHYDVSDMVGEVFWINLGVMPG